MTATADGDVVYALPPEATADDLEPEQPYRAQVNGIVQYGVFVDLSESVSGLIHESNLTGEYSVGDEIVVTLKTVEEGEELGDDTIVWSVLTIS